MAEVIDPIWIAWASADPQTREATQARLWRVREHYANAGAPGPLIARGWSDGRVGLAALALRDRETSWPGTWADDRVIGAFGYVPLTHEEGAAPAAGEEAARRWTREILTAPDSLPARALAPFVAGAIDRGSGRLVIVNDMLGAGRLYEGAAGPLTAWSNRLGAVPLFLGQPPSPSLLGWRLFAAMAWFIGRPTAMEGVERVSAGTVIEVAEGHVRRRATGALDAALADLSAPRGELVERAVEGMQAAARGAAARDGLPLRVDLSGGRDSRLAAAAAIAAGVEARLVTSDLVPGEADVARQLVARLSDPPEHDVRWGGEERKRYERDALERARAVHLVHDGMRHAAKLRGKNELPQPMPRGTTVSGHGGEIAHGFYLASEGAMSRVAGGGPEAALARLREAARRSHRGAREDVYEAADEQIRASLARGVELGLDPPRLLDWFYLTERFTHRSGLAADSGRANLFASEPFIRAAFSLAPDERLGAALHREAIARLVPEWRDVPFFVKRKPKPRRLSLRALRGPGGPADKRSPIWEGRDGEVLDRLIAAGGAWSELYDPDRARDLRERVRRGDENAHYQDVFEGIVYREAFGPHLDLLARAANRDPRPEELAAIELGDAAGGAGARA